MARDRETLRSVATNRKARHRFEILQEVECGIVLRGTEVKSLRSGHASIAEAWARLRGGELWLVGATIPEYSHGNIHNHEPTRERKLLLSRRELDRLGKQVRERGRTLVPLEIYFRGHLVKVRMALAQGRRLHDKRERERERSARREIAREVGRRR